MNFSSTEVYKANVNFLLEPSITIANAVNTDTSTAILLTVWNIALFGAADPLRTSSVYTYIRDPNLSITGPADAFSTWRCYAISRKNADYKVRHMFRCLLRFLIAFKSPDNIIQNGRRNREKFHSSLGINKRTNPRMRCAALPERWIEIECNEMCFD